MVETGPVGAPPFNHYTASAVSDLDADGVPNVFGYVRPNDAGTAIAGTAVGTADDCPSTGIYDRTTGLRVHSRVGPCNPNAGQNVF